MSAGRVHVIGAGLAGLGSAVALATAGRSITLYEAGVRAGGRCRSYYDPQLGRVIDNGNHLVLSGNTAVMRYVKRIGASANLVGPRAARFDFCELETGERWAVRPNASSVPWWLASPSHRVPGTSFSDYVAMAPLLGGKDQAIGDKLARRGRVWSHFIDPVLLAALNTDPREGSQRLAANVIRQSLARSGAATCPRIAHPTLAAAFVDPAITLLEAKGADVRMGARVTRLNFGADGVDTFDVGGKTVVLAGGEAVILAVPPWIAADLVPDLVTPTVFRSIINAHFAFTLPEALPDMLGIIGGTAQWLFRFEDRCAVTISAADALLDVDRAQLAEMIWQDICRAASISAPLPIWQIVKERRATFAATPEQDHRRPKTRTRWPNLLLAGDWTNTGLPATIEGALRSGEAAASALMGN